MVGPNFVSTIVIERNEQTEKLKEKLKFLSNFIKNADPDLYRRALMTYKKQHSQMEQRYVTYPDDMTK